MFNVHVLFSVLIVIKNIDNVVIQYQITLFSGCATAMKTSIPKISVAKVAQNPDRFINALVEETADKLGCGTKSKRSVIKKAKIRRQNEIKDKSGTIKENICKDSVPESINVSNEGNYISPNIIFPHIPRASWIDFETKLNSKETDEITKKLSICLARMHGFEVYDTHFTSLHFLRSAIVDSLINRKWNNLLKLVVMLSRNYNDPVFTKFIRHLCQVLKHYHPAIRGTKYEDQIDLIAEKYDQKRDSRTNVNNTV